MKADRLFYPALSFTLVVTLFGYVVQASAETRTHFGAAAKLGKGTARTYVNLKPDGSPLAIGITFTKSLLEGLPAKRNTTSRCFDLDGNGKINKHGECEGDLELKLSLPKELAKRSDIPFQWVGLNWNAEGHEPPGVWDLPHFDFHFYIMDQQAVQEIRTGPCGFFINCEDFKRATSPVPTKYVHHEHINVDAAVAAMGNHLIDSTSPEFGKPPEKFTHTWIFGAYDGHITFYEPMITVAYLVSRPKECVPIKQPQAWEKSGYYPTYYCIRYFHSRGEYTVSLEGLVYRKAG